MALSAHGSGSNGQAPRCEHVASIDPVPRQSAGCGHCLALGATWTGLEMCLACGWVACSDDSPGRHAKAHYEETDHPVVAALQPGSTRRWCYVHQRAV
jgi:uncharacterized UBP type Zn finger protein